MHSLAHCKAFREWLLPCCLMVSTLTSMNSSDRQPMGPASGGLGAASTRSQGNEAASGILAAMDGNVLLTQRHPSLQDEKIFQHTLTQPTLTSNLATFPIATPLPFTISECPESYVDTMNIADVTNSSETPVWQRASGTVVTLHPKSWRTRCVRLEPCKMRSHWALRVQSRGKRVMRPFTHRSDAI